MFTFTFQQWRLMQFQLLSAIQSTHQVHWQICFGSATPSQHATTDDTTERSGTSLNVDQSSAQSRQQTEDGAAASVSAQASSPPAPPARHGSAERGSPVRGSPVRAKRTVTQPATSGPPTPSVPARSGRTLSPQGIHGQSGSLESLTIRINVLESRLSEDVAQTRLQLDQKLQGFMEEVQQKFVQAEDTYAQYMAPILEKCQKADDKHAELQQKIIATSERLTDLDVEIRSMKVHLREQPPSMSHLEQTEPRQFNMGTPPESVGLPQACPTVGRPTMPQSGYWTGPQPVPAAQSSWTGAQAECPSAGPPTACGGQHFMPGAPTQSPASAPQAHFAPTPPMGQSQPWAQSSQAS